MVFVSVSLVPLHYKIWVIRGEALTRRRHSICGHTSGERKIGYIGATGRRTGMVVAVSGQL